jgi:phosphoglycolate phosphatase
MITSIIFDLDGTLLNTLDDLWASVNYSLAQNGFPLRSKSEIRSFLGNGVRVLIEKSLPQNIEKTDYEHVLNTFRSYYIAHAMDKTCPYPGVFELLQNLKERGIKTAIVSNKPESAVQELYQNLFKDVIDIALGECPDVLRKPSPDMVLKALKLLGSNSSSSVYVGDSEVDYATAQNSGLRFVGVSWGFRDRAFLEELGVDLIIDKANELLWEL